MQPPHGQPGPGQVAQHPVGMRCQLDGAVLLLQTDRSAPRPRDVRGRKVRQVQLGRAGPGAPSLGHERLVLPLPGHLVAVGGGGEGGDAPARPGDRVPLHPPHPGVPLPTASRHAAGALPGPRAHLEDPWIFRPRLPGGVRRGRGLAGSGERSHLHFQVLGRVPVHERGGECNTVVHLLTFCSVVDTFGPIKSPRGAADGWVTARLAPPYTYTAPWVIIECCR